jgi:integrase
VGAVSALAKTSYATPGVSGPYQDLAATRAAVRLDAARRDHGRRGRALPRRTRGKEARREADQQRPRRALEGVEVRRRVRAGLEKAPKVGLFKIERPEIVAWDFAQYARLLAAAKAESEEWYAAVCLAGEAGLRVGEIKALRWREDVDLIAKTITVNQQTCRGETGTPKGRTRRTVPIRRRSTMH